MKKQLLSNKRLRPYETLLQVCQESDLQYYEMLNLDDDIDDVTGKMPDKNQVEVARAEEMMVFKEHDVYTKVPIEEAVNETGKQPIGVRWLDINKGDEVQPEYRSRLVAKEIKRDQRDDLFAATPPLEAKKALLSLAATAEYGRKKGK